MLKRCDARWARVHQNPLIPSSRDYPWAEKQISGQNAILPIAWSSCLTDKVVTAPQRRGRWGLGTARDSQQKHFCSNGLKPICANNWQPCGHRGGRGVASLRGGGVGRRAGPRAAAPVLRIGFGSRPALPEDCGWRQGCAALAGRSPGASRSRKPRPPGCRRSITRSSPSSRQGRLLVGGLRHQLPLPGWHRGVRPGDDRRLVLKASTSATALSTARRLQRVAMPLWQAVIAPGQGAVTACKLKSSRPRR